MPSGSVSTNSTLFTFASSPGAATVSAMADPDLDALLAMLRDPNVESRQIAAVAGCPREEAGRAARLALGIARAKADDVLSLPGLLAAAVARAGLGAGRADLLVALCAHPSREAAKEAKRGLHLLRARGVEAPEPPRAAPPATPAPEPALHAYASAIDGHGERALWLPRVVAGQGIEVAQAVLSDERGFVELQLALLGRREWRVFARGLLERGRSMGIVAIDAGLAHAMIAAARAINERTGQPPPAGADRWLGQLGAAPALPDPPAPPGAGLPSPGV